MTESREPHESIGPATMRHLREVLDDHARFWGTRDLRAFHLPTLIHEFPQTCLVATTGNEIHGYIIGFVTPDHVAYAHLIATRDDTRGTGLGRRLYSAFATAARPLGATDLKAITTPTNHTSINFHKALGFVTRLVEDYNGPGQPRIVFTRNLNPPF
ncbi:GNAT family N-acetyltransferase [Nocardia tengchongensis]|uniref:GNAT family N-acetyltransferase n=1 Tax=Nocardia tengchongensis TaxID=2055889 RepID=UPI003620B9E3